MCFYHLNADNPFSVINIFVYDKKRASRSSEPNDSRSKWPQTRRATTLFSSLRSAPHLGVCFFWFSFIICVRCVFSFSCCVVASYFFFLHRRIYLKYVYLERLNIVGILSCSSVKRNIISIYTYTFRRLTYILCYRSFCVCGCVCMCVCSPETQSASQNILCICGVCMCKNHHLFSSPFGEQTTINPLPNNPILTLRHSLCCCC